MINFKNGPIKKSNQHSNSNNNNILIEESEIENEYKKWFKHHFDSENGNSKLSKRNNKVIRINE